MSEVKKPYPVLDSLRHNGKKYFPDSDNNVVELTALEAAPLLTIGVVGESSDSQGNQAPEGAEKTAKIKEAIASLDKENKALFTNAGVPKTDAIAAVTGWPVSAVDRDEALKEAAE